MESLLNWGREKISTPDQSIDKIKSVLLSISKELVDYPNEVAITVTEEDQITKLCLTANKSDLGKIIGKEGPETDPALIASHEKLYNDYSVTPAEMEKYRKL